MPGQQAAFLNGADTEISLLACEKLPGLWSEREKRRKALPLPSPFKHCLLPAAALEVGIAPEPCHLVPRKIIEAHWQHHPLPCVLHRWGPGEAPMGMLSSTMFWKHLPPGTILSTRKTKRFSLQKYCYEPRGPVIPGRKDLVLPRGGDNLQHGQGNLSKPPFISEASLFFQRPLQHNALWKVPIRTETKLHRAASLLCVPHGEPCTLTRAWGRWDVVTISKKKKIIKANQLNSTSP